MGHRRQFDGRAAGRGTGADGAIRLPRILILVTLGLPIFLILSQDTAPTARVAAAGRSDPRGVSACAHCPKSAEPCLLIRC